MTNRRGFLSFWCGMVIVYLGVMLLLNHIPPNWILFYQTPKGMDKLVHFLMYVGLAALCAKFIQPIQCGCRWVWLAVVLFVIAGVTQPWFGRELCWIDMLANLLGISSVILLFIWKEKIISNTG